jgi:hypothetical protein
MCKTVRLSSEEKLENIKGISPRSFSALRSYIIKMLMKI